MAESTGFNALMKVAGLWQDWNVEEEKTRQWELEQRAIQGRWGVEERRKQQVAIAQQDRAERAHTLKVFDGFRTLWENASKNPALRKHWKELLGTYIGGLSPKNQQWLEPHMKGGPTDPEVMKEEFFDRKNPRTPQPVRREGEVDRDYNNRLAPWAGQEYRRNWQKQRYMLGPAAIGPPQELIPYGEDDNNNPVYLRMPKDGIPTFETRAGAEFAAIEEEGGHFKRKMAKDSLRNNKGIEEGPTTYATVGNREYSYTQTYNWLTGEKGVDRIDVGPTQLRREDLKKSVANPPPGFEEFQLNLIGGIKPSGIEGSTEGGRMYSIAHQWRSAQIEFRKEEQSIEELDYNFKKILESLWPGYVVRYKYDKGTIKWGRWYETANVFGDNPRIEAIPGIYVGAKHPKFLERGHEGEGKWIRAIYDSTNQVIYALNPENDRYEPAMSEMEYLNLWNGEGPIPIEEFEAWEEGRKE